MTGHTNPFRPNSRWVQWGPRSRSKPIQDHTLTLASRSCRALRAVDTGHPAAMTTSQGDTEIHRLFDTLGDQAGRTVGHFGGWR